MFKLIVNCSCVQKRNKKQIEIFHLPGVVDPRTLQYKKAETSFEFQNLKKCQLHQREFKLSVKSTMSSVTYFTFHRNDKFYYKSLSKAHKF